MDRQAAVAGPAVGRMPGQPASLTGWRCQPGVEGRPGARLGRLCYSHVYQ